MSSFQLDLTEKKPYLDKSLKNFVITLIFIFSIGIYSQEKTIITIEKAEFFEKNEEKFPGASILSKGDNSRVTISHDGAILKCDEAFFYEKKNFIEAYGNVSLNQGDTLSLDSNYLEYNGDTKLAFAKGDVVLNEIESKLKDIYSNLDPWQTALVARHQDRPKIYPDTAATRTRRPRRTKNTKKTVQKRAEAKDLNLVCWAGIARVPPEKPQKTL